jgi:hypothetical protein
MNSIARARIASWIVTGKVRARIWLTGSPENEVPKSPTKIPPRYRKYWTMNG